MCVYMCVYIYEYVCTHQVFICVYTSGELLSRLYMYKYVLHMCMCEYACIYVCIYDYMCVYIRYRGNEEFYFFLYVFFIYIFYIYMTICVYTSGAEETRSCSHASLFCARVKTLSRLFSAVSRSLLPYK